MSSAAKPDPLRLGFLATMEIPEQGFVGGLLVTSRHGRPLEFQCTAPVKPNRTQQILYGTTLGPFLMGELIGKTLLEKVGVKPHLVLTEQQEVLELRNHVAMPIACVEAKPTAGGGGDASSGAGLKLGRQWLRFHQGHIEDEESIRAHTKDIPGEADMREPFDRVREALQETIRSGALR